MDITLLAGGYFLGIRYAKAPTAVRTDWNEFTKDYFLSRKTLINVLLLVDASIPYQQVDLDCVDWLGRKKVCPLLQLVRYGLK